MSPNFIVLAQSHCFCKSFSVPFCQKVHTSTPMSRFEQITVGERWTLDQPGSLETSEASVRKKEHLALRCNCLYVKGTWCIIFRHTCTVHNTRHKYAVEQKMEQTGTRKTCAYTATFNNIAVLQKTSVYHVCMTHIKSWRFMSIWWFYAWTRHKVHSFIYFL